jgi:hypothetical protein
LTSPFLAFLLLGTKFRHVEDVENVFRLAAQPDIDETRAPDNN